jgi:ribosome-binding protein aMBF1 (putative translation factor)
MPFECDVCGEEVSYSERVFVLRNHAEIVICSKCLRKKKPTA